MRKIAQDANDLRRGIAAAVTRLPTSSTPADACARAASSLLAIVGFVPSEGLELLFPLGAGAIVDADIPLFCPEFMHCFVIPEGNRVPSIFLRKGEGMSASLSYTGGGGGKAGGAVELLAGGPG